MGAKGEVAMSEGISRNGWYNHRVTDVCYQNEDCIFQHTRHFADVGQFGSFGSNGEDNLFVC